MMTRQLNRENKGGILLTQAVCIAACDTALQRAIDLYNAGSYRKSIDILKGQAQG